MSNLIEILKDEVYVSAEEITKMMYEKILPKNVEKLSDIILIDNNKKYYRQNHAIEMLFRIQNNIRGIIESIAYDASKYNEVNIEKIENEVLGLEGNNITFNEFNKILISNDNDLKMRNKDLTSFLNHKGFISIKMQGNGRKLYTPQKEFVEKGVFYLMKHTYNKPGFDKKGVTLTCKITPYGVHYLTNYFIKHKNEVLSFIKN